ncbi:MAG: NADH-quinone oxidoreductase subunit H [Coriobacteriales bacterium]|nr:NADH-quinone oxidoreductase subunit H [Coriobacteriales bacterium]
MNLLSFLIALIGFAVAAPVLGCLIAGLDRRISARLQGRVGPPLLQPYYDLRKLLAKDDATVNRYQGFYVALALALTIFSGAVFFAGGNFLLVIFLLTLSVLFFIIAAYSTRSPYAEIGAAREIIQIMSYEPMLILMAAAFFVATGSFDVSAAFALGRPIIVVLPLIFLGLVFILTIKLRKSPFDLSSSHHAHQELVKGITTEMSGRTLALVELMHWYETVLFLGWVGLFFIWGSWWAAALAVLVVIVIYLLEILIDNTFARVKWQVVLVSSWAVTFVTVAVNLFILRIL